MSSLVALSSSLKQRLAVTSDDKKAVKKEGVNNDNEGLRQREVEFIYHSVSIYKRIGHINASHIYSARQMDDLGSSKKAWRGSFKQQKLDRVFMVKATSAASREDIRRAEAEVRLFRQLREHPLISKLIDCGVSSMLHDSHDRPMPLDDDSFDTKKLYCLLFDNCPDGTLADMIRRRGRNLRNSQPIGLLGKFSMRNSQSTSHKSTNGYLPIETVLDIFGQMVEAVSALHTYQRSDSGGESDSTPTTSLRNRPRRKVGITLIDLTLESFVVKKRPAKKKGLGSAFDVNLCNFGAGIPGKLNLRIKHRRSYAARLIEEITNPCYRAPEMTNLHMKDELSDKCDIWSLGCCFYSLLFLKDCFETSSKLSIINGDYEIPEDNPYPPDVIRFLARMLTVDPARRPTTGELANHLQQLESAVYSKGATRLTLDAFLSKNDTKKPSGRNNRTSKSVTFEGTSAMIQNEQARVEAHTEKALSDSAAVDKILDDSGRGGGGSTTEEGESSQSSISRSGQSDAALYSSMGDSLMSGRTFDLDSSMGGSMTDGSTSVSQTGSESDGTEWLEFQPGSHDGSVLRKQDTVKFSVPISASKKDRPKKSKNHHDPLSLGKTGGAGEKRRQRKKPDNPLADWKAGVLSRLSSRSLDRIELGEDSLNSLDTEDSGGKPSPPEAPSDPSMKTAERYLHPESALLASRPTEMPMQSPRTPGACSADESRNVPSSSESSTSAMQTPHAIRDRIAAPPLSSSTISSAPMSSNRSQADGSISSATDISTPKSELASSITSTSTTPISNTSNASPAQSSDRPCRKLKKNHVDFGALPQLLEQAGQSTENLIFDDTSMTSNSYSRSLSRPSRKKIKSSSPESDGGSAPTPKKAVATAMPPVVAEEAVPMESSSSFVFASDFENAFPTDNDTEETDKSDKPEDPPVVHQFESPPLEPQKPDLISSAKKPKKPPPHESSPEPEMTLGDVKVSPVPSPNDSRSTWDSFTMDFSQSQGTDGWSFDSKRGLDTKPALKISTSKDDLSRSQCSRDLTAGSSLADQPKTQEVGQNSSENEDYDGDLNAPERWFLGRGPPTFDTRGLLIKSLSPPRGLDPSKVDPIKEDKQKDGSTVGTDKEGWEGASNSLQERFVVIDDIAADGHTRDVDDLDAPEHVGGSAGGGDDSSSPNGLSKGNNPPLGGNLTGGWVNDFVMTPQYKKEPLDPTHLRTVRSASDVPRRYDKFVSDIGNVYKPSGEDKIKDHHPSNGHKEGKTKKKHDKARDSPGGDVVLRRRTHPKGSGKKDPPPLAKEIAPELLSTDTNIPPGDEAMPDVSRPPPMIRTDPSREEDSYEDLLQESMARQSVVIEHRGDFQPLDPLSAMSRSEIVAYNEFQMRKGRANDDQPISKILDMLKAADIHLTKSGRGGSGGDAAFNVSYPPPSPLQATQRYNDYVESTNRFDFEPPPEDNEPYSDDYTEDDIPLEIEIIPDHPRASLPSRKTPKKGRSKHKSKKTRGGRKSRRSRR